MCNLLIPLCPFVLHSVTTSAQCGQQYVGSSDAKILFSYLSKRPYDSHSSRSRQHPSQMQTTSLAQNATKLYKRTNWHTCSCFFHRVAVLHPMPGPSRPTFGMAYKPCKRCSSAAKTLKPMRMGGIGDKGDPYWDRCIFAGARGVFENGFGDEDDRTGGNMKFSSPNVDAARGVRPTEDAVRPDDSDHRTDHHAPRSRGYDYQDAQDSRSQSFHHKQEDPSEQRAQRHKDDDRNHYVTRTSNSAKISYSEDLDRYLSDTYASKLRLKA
jgi:hypothetical protein